MTVSKEYLRSRLASANEAASDARLQYELDLEAQAEAEQEAYEDFLASAEFDNFNEWWEGGNGA